MLVAIGEAEMWFRCFHRIDWFYYFSDFSNLSKNKNSWNIARCHRKIMPSGVENICMNGQWAEMTS